MVLNKLVREQVPTNVTKVKNGGVCFNVLRWKMCIVVCKHRDSVKVLTPKTRFYTSND